MNSAGWKPSAFRRALVRILTNRPKIDPVSGNATLSHGILFPAMGLVGIGFAGFFFVMAIVGPGPGTSPLLGLIIAAIGLPFLIAGAAFLIEGLGSRVTISHDTVVAKALWPGYPKTIRWDEIKSVDYAYSSFDFVVTSTRGVSMKVSLRFSGVWYLVDQFKKRLDPLVYSRLYYQAKPMIDAFRRQSDVQHKFSD